MMQKKAITLALSAALSVTLFGAPRASAENERITPVAHDLTEAECSACHMAYPPALLPVRSWKKIMTTLDDHFGEDASLDDQSRAQIEAYLVLNAADTGGRARGVLWRVSPQDTPLRISEMPWFVSQHNHEVSRRAMKRAGSMANCTACHRSAGRGNYDDD